MGKQIDGYHLIQECTVAPYEGREVDRQTGSRTTAKEYLKILFKNLTHDIEVIVLGCFGVMLGLFTLSYSQNEDMGIFISENALLSRGYGLYSQIFELKDPLFLWSGGLTTWMFGLRGPFLLDAAFVTIAPLVAYGYARSLKISRAWSTIAAVGFSGSLTGVYFTTLRTGTIALVLIVCALWSTQNKKMFLGGALIVAVIGFKMSFIPCLLGLMVYIFASRKELKNLITFALGISSSLITVVGILIIRGEFSGFVEMIQVNFHYRSVYPRVIGFTPGINGHIQTINTYGSSFNYLVFTLILLVTILAQRLKNKLHQLEASVLVVTFAGPIIVLLSSAMWSHHLQILSICVYVLILMIGMYLQDFGISRNVIVRLISSLLILTLFMALNVTGWRLPLRPATALVDVINPKWIDPSENKFVSEHPTMFRLEKKFARLGPNDDNGLMGFLPKEWHLSCRYYSQYGHETESMVNEIINCIATKPNYLFISPGFFALERVSGTYKKLKSRVEITLKRNFKCVAIVDREGAQFCTRIGINQKIAS